MAKTGLFGGGGGQPPKFSSQPGGFFRRGQGGILPERGSRAQLDMVQALLASSMQSSQGSGSPLLAFLAPMIGGAVGARTNGLYKDAQQGRDDSAIDTLMSAMGGPARAPVLPGSRNPNYSAMAAGGGPTKAAAAMSSGGGDRDLLAKTLMAEAGGEGPMGMLAAGAVIANRVKSGGYGDGLSGVIMKPGQFSAWNGVTGYAGGEGALNMAQIKPSAEAYQAADAILSGQYQDPTGGATHYYNPSVANPKWGQRNGGNWQRIGNHIFGSADGEGRTPARDAASRIASGDFSTFSGFGQPQMDRDSMRSLIGLMTNQEVSEPIRNLAGSMLSDAMGNRGGMSPRDQIGLAGDMLGLEQAMGASGPEYRPATPEEAAAYGATAGQIGPDGRFYPTGRGGTASGEAGVMRQRNEATAIISEAIASLETQGLTREEALAAIARDPIYAPQLQQLGIDPADIARKSVMEGAEEQKGGRGLFGWMFGREDTPQPAPVPAAPPPPAKEPENDPLGIRG